jgi:hypothetical protein
MSTSVARKHARAATLCDQADAVAQVSAADAPALDAAALAHATTALALMSSFAFPGR